MISNEYKCIFVHIEKTGGTSIETAFDQTNIFKEYTKHLTAIGSKELYLNFDEYFKFGFVRNPWDLIVSIHSFFKYKPEDFKRITKWKLLGGVAPTDVKQTRYVDRKGYDDFLKNTKAEYLGWGYWFMTHNQLDILSDKNGNLLVDYIGRFETLQKDFDYICDRIGKEKIILPHVYKTDHVHYTEYYDDELMNIVGEKFKRDIDFFGYKFGD